MAESFTQPVHRRTERIPRMQNRIQLTSTSPSSETLQVPTWKRVLDLLCILAVLPILLPLMLLISLLIKVLSPGPILFKQQRIGFRGKEFPCLKFRTMVVNAETRSHQGHLADLMKSNAPMIKMDAKGDPRLIRFGSLLRSMGLDELPQIINVIRGEMSLVGPRPCLPYEHEKYLPRHKRRHDTLPGLTGLWQVNGKNRTTFRQMIAMDIWYAKNKNLALDIWIMSRTIPALFTQVKDLQNRNRKPKDRIIWFPNTRRASAIADSFLQAEFKKTKSLGGKSERKTIWQNRFE